MRFPGGPMIGLLYECCPRRALSVANRLVHPEHAQRSTLNGAERRFESTVDSCVMKLCDGGSLCSLSRSEAHRAPDIVDGDLADALDVLLEQMSPEDVPIQVRAELSRLGICDPGKTVRLRGVHDGTAHLVNIGDRLDEDKDCVGLCG